jgi:hypothetical protein
MSELDFKLQSQEILRKGKLGNCVRNWSSLSELKKDNYVGKVTVRSKDRNARYTLVKYAVDYADITNVVEEFRARGLREEDIYFNEAVPDDLLIVQGEVGYVQGQFVLRYSTEKNTKMRDAMDSAEHIVGLAGRLLLKQVMTLDSYADLLDLFDEHPDHIVEFGVYACHLGWAKGRNTIIWDVRNY